MTEPDVSATLDALERKLRDLERELHSASEPVASPLPAPTRGEGLAELAGQVDELGSYRERLARAQRALEEEYGRMLARLEGLVGGEAAVAAPRPREPAPEPAAVASWLVDAGPFADLAALGAFERELSQLGSVDVT